jgi:probable rRNA maturation factor
MPTTSTSSKSSVVVQFAVPRRGLPSAASFRRWIQGNVTVRIVGAREGRALNRQFRGRDQATNVLSFRYGDGHGDVVLCHPVVAREARVQGKALAAHYAHLAVHGMLHLRGYDHLKKRDAERMEQAEARILRRLGFENPYG